MFREVVGSIFSMMKHFESFWLSVKYSRPTSIYGFGLGEVEMPPKVNVDTDVLFQKFHDGFDRYRDMWKKVLAQDLYKKLLEMEGMTERVFAFPTDLWARILYDLTVGYRDSVCDPVSMIDSLIPLYYGRTFSFVKRTKRMSTRQAEEAIEEDCMTFEMTKPYLVQRWKGK
jgi:hypothetical protein